MISKTNYQIEGNLPSLKEMHQFSDFKTVLNYPSGRFFYDPWLLKEEYQGTFWDYALKKLPPHGEARIIMLDKKENYMSHADIDNRWHLNITGNRCYIINIDQEKMYLLKNDNYWYSLETGIRHTATNFGDCPRYQVVVRQLLPDNLLENPIPVKIFLKEQRYDARYIFDDVFSPVLHSLAHNGHLSNFKVEDTTVFFDLEKTKKDELPKHDKVFSVEF